jgi:hypothetical protein
MVKLRGPDPHLMDHGGAGPQWTLDRVLVMTSSELGRTTALGHGGSPAMARQRERVARGVHLRPHRGAGGDVAIGRWW